MDLKKVIREIEGYPKEGINFKDITTLLVNPEALSFALNEITSAFKGKGITKVMGLEARGFILGGAIADRLGAGFVPVRKKGKLPYKTMQESYQLEYGEDVVEMHVDALNEDDVVLIHDDLLATGGTAFAALNLAKKCGVKTVLFSFICDLTFIQSENKDVILSYNPHVLVEY